MCVPGGYPGISQKSRCNDELVCMNTVQMSETILNFLTSIVTCDESWIHHYDPLSKRQSSVWKRSNSPPPKKYRSSLSAGKVMLLLFFDAHRMILQHWVPRAQTVNGDYYANILKTHLRGAMRKKRLDLLKKQWFLLQDNAWPHTTAVALAELTEIGGTALKHPPYSPDLATCDFWAFPTLKRQLRGKRFSSDEVRNAMAAVLKGVSQNNLFHVFELFIKCCKKCVQCEGCYFEKEKTVGPVESSDSE